MLSASPADDGVYVCRVEGQVLQHRDVDCRHQLPKVPDALMEDLPTGELLPVALPAHPACQRTDGFVRVPSLGRQFVQPAGPVGADVESGSASLDLQVVHHLAGLRAEEHVPLDPQGGAQAGAVDLHVDGVLNDQGDDGGHGDDEDEQGVVAPSFAGGEVGAAAEGGPHSSVPANEAFRSDRVALVEHFQRRRATDLVVSVRELRFPPDSVLHPQPSTFAALFLCLD